MNYTKIIFNIVELFAFILPCIPNSFIVRFSILSIYFIAHYFKLQYAYSKLKLEYINFTSNFVGTI